MNLRSWRQKVEAELCELENTGRFDVADWVAEELWKHHDFHDQGDFSATIIPGNGREVTWKAIDRRRSPTPVAIPTREPDANDSAEARPAENRLDTLQHPADNALGYRPSTTETVHSSIQQSIPVLSQIQRTAALIDVELDSFGGGVITFSQAREQKLWIGHNHSGRAFCLTCPCPLMIAPTGADFPYTASEGTHHFIPVCFRIDSVDNDATLRHFRDVHKEEFSDIGGMLRKYGSEIQTEGVRLDTWAIVGHNMSMQLWQESFNEERKDVDSKMLQQWQKPGHFVYSKSRSIKRSKVPANNFVFSRPELHEEFIVYCLSRTCSEPNFVDDPLHNKTAIHHFQRHGMQLDDSQIIEMFGLRVIPDLKCTNTHEPQHEPRSVNGLEPVPAVTQNGDQSVRPEAREVKQRPRRRRTSQRKAKSTVEKKEYSPWIAGEQMIQYEGVKVERITGRRDRPRGHAICKEYELHFAGCHESKWVTISKLGELREIVESFDRGNGEETPWLAKQKKKF